MTKNGIIRLSLFCIILVAACILSGIIILNTKYITPVTQWVIRETISPSFKAERITYHFPLQFEFTNARLTRNSSAIKNIDIWINPYETSFTQVVLDTIVINGIDLNSQENNWLSNPYIKLHQLAAKNITYTNSNGISLQNADIQIDAPSWSQSSQVIPYGEVQLYAKKLLWQGETLDNILLTGQYNKHNSQIDGLSFDWRKASVSIVAEQENQHWNISTISAEGLNLSFSQYKQIEYKLRNLITHSIRKVDRLDILRSNFATPDVKVINCDLSAANFTVGKPSQMMWKQENASLSLSADSITTAGYQWIEPDLDISFTPDTINVKDSNASLLQGSIHFSGQFSPEKVVVHDMQLTGLKLFIEPGDQTQSPWLVSYLSQVNNIYAENIELHNNQIIQLASKPYWQLSGINVDATNTQLNTEHKWGLWGGNLNISVDSLSYGKLIASQGVVEMHSKQNTWNLDRLFIPLKEGYLKAHGQWAFKDEGAPWQLTLEADSVPLHQIPLLPFHLEGFSDISLDARGLSGDSVIFRQTLSGEAQVSIRDGLLDLKQGNSLSFNLPAIDIAADRGKIEIPQTSLDSEDPALEAKISGILNFTKPGNDEINLIIKSREDGQERQTNLLDPSLYQEDHHSEEKNK